MDASNAAVKVFVMPVFGPKCHFLVSKGQGCSRSAVIGTKRCIFHTGDPAAGANFKELIQNKDGDWRGFKLPGGLNLSEYFDSLPAKIQFPIDLSSAEIGGLVIDEIIFCEPVNLSEISCSGPTHFRKAIFENDCKLDNSNFTSFYMRGVLFKGKLLASGMRCKEDFRFLGSAESETNFNEATFEGAAHFRGYRSIGVSLGTGGRESSQKIIPCLSGEIHFNDVTFFNPSQSLIRLADFSEAHVVGTNFEGVSLVDIEWPTGKDGRRKIWDDLWTRKSKDEDYKHFAVRRIESQYRNLRRAHEMQKDFSAANDFYVGEMEAKRRGMDNPWKRHIFSVPAIYRLSCLYGTSPSRALTIFLLLAFSYGTLSAAAAQFEFSAASLVMDSNLFVLLNGVLAKFLEFLFDGLRLMIPGGAKAAAAAVTMQTYLNVTFRILGALQLAMLIITFRNMVKRG